jgi:hypothetical protein
MALALVGVRADQGDDEKEREGNQDVGDTPRDEAHYFGRGR